MKISGLILQKDFLLKKKKKGILFLIYSYNTNTFVLRILTYFGFGIWIFDLTNYFILCIKIST